MSQTSHRGPDRERFWQEAVAGWKKSGQTIAAFCTARGLSQASFYAWRRKFARHDEVAPAATFVPLTVVPDAVVEIVLPTGVVVRVPATADAAAVAKLVAALGTAPC
jgi:transposase-like protein